MKLRLHHVNVCSDDMEEFNTFYSEVLGLKVLPPLPMIELEEEVRSEPEQGGDWEQDVGFLRCDWDTDELQIHASRRQVYLGARMGHAVNPLITGHLAFRTDDLDELRARLTKAGVPFSDYGEWSVKGWHQIFFADPAGNVIEVHQVIT